MMKIKTNHKWLSQWLSLGRFLCKIGTFSLTEEFQATTRVFTAVKHRTRLSQLPLSILYQMPDHRVQQLSADRAFLASVIVADVLRISQQYLFRCAIIANQMAAALRDNRVRVTYLFLAAVANVLHAVVGKN